MEQVETILEKIKQLSSKIEPKAEDRAIDASRQAQIQESFDVIQSLLRGENVSGIEYIEENSDEVLNHLKLIPKKRIQNLLKTSHNHLSPFVYESYFDIIEALAIFQSADTLKELSTDYIVPTINNVKKGGVTRIIKERQLKSYILLKNILSSENEGCIEFVQTNLKNIQKILLNAVQAKKHNSQIIRLT